MWFSFLTTLCFYSALVGQHLPQILFQATSQDTKAPKIITPELSNYVEQTLKTYDVPGMSLAVVRKDGTVELGAWGHKTENGDPATPDTMYYIASCSKAFAAAAMGILMDDFTNGRNVTALPPGLALFNWNTKVKDLLPGEWALQDEWASEKASVRDILAHVSGLGSHHLSYGPLQTPGDIVSQLRYLRPTYELREMYHYNNHMFVVASHIISTYTGSYTQFVKERIFDPLNMTSTTFSLSEAVNSGKMSQNWASQGNGRRIPHWMNDGVAHMMAGSGGIISSVVDVAKWVEVLLNSGFHTHSNTTIIPKSAFDQITSAQVVAGGAPGPVVGYCAGWLRETFLGHDIVWHNGGIPGVHAQLAFLPEDGVGLIELLNIDGKFQAVVDVQRRVFEEALGLKHAMETIIEESADIRSHGLQSMFNESAPPLNLRKYSGAYSNPAYGTITFCDPLTISSYCDQTRSDFANFNFGSAPQLLATWPRVWTSHVRVIFVDDGSLHVEFFVLFPHGYGADVSPFSMLSGTSTGLSEFTVENGAITGFQLTTDAGEGDAWFQKI